MKRARWVIPVLLFLASSLQAQGSYSYYYSQTLWPSNWGNWNYWTGYMPSVNCYDSPLTGDYYCGATNSYYGVATALNTAYFNGARGEVRLTIARSSDALPSIENYYAFLSADSGLSTFFTLVLSCSSGGVYFYKQQYDYGSGSYVATLLASAPATCTDPVTFRAVLNDTAGSTKTAIAYMGGTRVLKYTWTPSSGEPNGSSTGFGVDAQGYSSSPRITNVDLGLPDVTPPNAISSSSIGKSAYINHVDLNWPAATDDTYGTGVYNYEVWRNGSFLGSTTGLTFSDTTVNPVTTYAYTLRAVDYHGNYADTTFNVTTPFVSTSGPYPSATPEGRRVGVRSTGAYWGAGGENIDVMSGNLNFTLPLVKAQARSGWGVGFNLTYNSQNWRYDSGGNRNFGEDVGYGYGWRLLAGSLTPVLSDPFTVSYYLFVDSTGAEYRLDQNSGNIWTSKESIYVSYDAGAMRLHFRDGSFWYLGCISAVGEADQGVMYPTLMQDTNGNQVLIAYQTSSGASWSNSSARITLIEDARGNGSITYTLTYSGGHLSALTSNVGTGENYTFSYLTGQSICSPFNGSGCVTTAVMRDVTINITSHNTYHEFTYNGSGELTQVLLPYKGYLSYDYATTTYSSSRSYREVIHRNLSKDGGAPTQYTLAHESSPGSDVHQFTTLDDPGGVGEKYWSFATSGLAEGLVTQYQGRQLPGPVAKVQNDYTWTQDAASNSYIASATTTADPSQSYAAARKTDQTVDTHGNVTQVKTYDYGNLTTPVRTDNYTYLNSSNYTSLYIFNRLASTPTTTITYEGSTATPPGDAHEWVSPGTSYRGNASTITSPAGTQTITYDFAGGVLTNTVNGLTSSVSTTNATNYTVPSQITVGSLSTSMTYNSFLGLTSQTAPNSASTTIGYEDPARPNSATSPFGATTTTAYNDIASPPNVQTSVNGRWTKTTMDGLGRTIKVESGYSTTTVSVAETEYDSYGSSPTGMVKRTSLPHAPGGTQIWTTNTYDGIGRTLTTVTAGTETTSSTTYSYQGNTVTVTDATGNWKKYTSNALGQLIQVNEPNPGSSGGGSPTNYALSSNSAVASASSQYSSNFPVSSVNDGDKLGSNWGNGGGWNDAAGPPSWVEIDFAGQKTINEIDVYTLADCSPNCASITPSQTATSFGNSAFQVQYDNAGSWQTVPGGSISSNTLAWNKLTFSSVTTGKIRVNITAAREGYSRLVELEAWGSGGGGTGSDYITNYSYDSLGHLTGVSMPRPSGTQTRTFNYGSPAGGQLLGATNPENGTVSYTYNSDKTLATKTDAKNQQTQYSYDSLKRVTQIRRGTYSGTFTEDACQREDYSYETNPYDGTFSQYTAGRLAAVQYKGGFNAGASPTCDTTFTEMYSYSPAGSSVKKRLRVARTAGTFDLDSQYTYDNEGRMTAQQYPSTWNGSAWVAGPNLGNTFDSMGRLQKLTDLAASSDIISNTTYGAAGQLLSTTGAGGAPSETRTYNSIGQMTQLHLGSLNIQYAYSATQNNGKITSETDVVSGEQVTYAYDSLNRLASATSSVSPGWGQSYTYDGFGNLTTQTVTKGTAPSLSVSYDPATNRQTSECADANGNVNSASSCTNGNYFDIENRLLRNGGSSLVWAYSYAPGNKRVWRGVWSGSTQTTDEVTYWGVSGQKLVTYQLSVSGSTLVATATGTNQYFGGKLIKNATGYITPDRLGSIGKYFPYGQERPSATTDGKEKFATYFRDSETGLDYADQRYHQVGIGRFLTPDPYSGSASANDPGSWNRYTYSSGDPVNNSDPSGLDDSAFCGNKAAWQNNPVGAMNTCVGNGGFGNIQDSLGAAASGGIQCGNCYGFPSDNVPNNVDGHGVWNSIKSFFGFGPSVPDVYSSFIPDGSDANTIRLADGINHMNPGGLVNAIGAPMLGIPGAVAAGGLAAGALSGSTATVPSILYGDVQASFNFGASVQPTITTSIDGLSQVFSTPAPSSLWVTTEQITSGSQATSLLSLPPANSATQIVTGTIIPGSTAVFGTAAPLFGQPGGGFQIFVQAAGCLLFGPSCGLSH